MILTILSKMMTENLKNYINLVNNQSILAFIDVKNVTMKLS